MGERRDDNTSSEDNNDESMRQQSDYVEAMERSSRILAAWQIAPIRRKGAGLPMLLVIVFQNVEAGLELRDGWQRRRIWMRLMSDTSDIGPMGSKSKSMRAT